jgi:hypothetical protein
MALPQALDAGPKAVAAASEQAKAAFWSICGDAANLP